MPAQSGFKITGMFHPTAIVPDLHELHAFYRDFFGAPSRTILFSNGITNVYRSFTLVSDVWIENMSPEPMHFSPYRMFVDTVGAHWLFPCFYVEDMQDLIYQLHVRHRIRINAVGTGAPLFGLPYGHPGRTNAFTNPADTGMILEFVEAEREFHESELGDPRQLEGWTIKAPDDATNPLGIVRISHHTLAATPEAVGKLRWALEEVCGAREFSPQRPPTTGEGDATWLRVGNLEDVRFEILVGGDGDAAADVGRVNTCYHRMTFEVADLGVVRSRAAELGIPLEHDADGLVVLSPSGTVGIRFAFTDRATDDWAEAE